MVQKKLNFNQPILSVRRTSLKTDSQILFDQTKESNALPLPPSHRPESNSGPVRHPGSVPFLWEQIPGQPKEEILAQHSSELPPNQVEAVHGASQDLDESSTISKATDSTDRSEELAVDGLDVLHGAHDYGVYVLKPKNQEQEQRRKVVNQDKPVLLHCRPSFEKRKYFYCKEKERSDDDGGEQHENVITVCCLLPQSCLKSSVCSLNLDHATRVMNRVMTFPLSSSSAGSENDEYAVKPSDRIGTFLEETTDKEGFVTLQELLLADKEWPKEKAIYLDTVKKAEREATADDDDDESDVKTSKETKMVEEAESDSDSDQEWSSEEEDIRLAINKAAENARKKQQLSRATTTGSDVPTPPLPRSPSDSWLFRTLSSASTKKSSTSTTMSRFGNKY